MRETYELIVIGGGPAGLAAADAAWQQGLRSILIVEREKHLGGVLNQCIHTGFGLLSFGEELTGPEFAARYIDRIRAAGIEVMLETSVLRIDRNRDVFVSAAAGCRTLHAGSIILATGCRERACGAIDIPGTRPAGVLTAGAAQAYMNLYGYCVGRRVVVLGSGDIGLIMARRLTLEGAEVLACLEQNAVPGGLPRNLQQCLLDFGIPLMLRRTVTEIRGKNRVEQLVSMAVDPALRPIPGTEIVFDCDTLLLSVGLIPENELGRGAGISMDSDTGGAVVFENNETEFPGIFACGNALHVHDLADAVAEESARAGSAAARFVHSGACRTDAVLELKTGEAVACIVPMKLRKTNLEDQVDISLRVRKVFGKNAYLTVAQGNRQLARFARAYLSPSRMERLRLPGRLLEALDPAAGPLTVSVTGEEE